MHGRPQDDQIYGDDYNITDGGNDTVNGGDGDDFLRGDVDDKGVGCERFHAQPNRSGRPSRPRARRARPSRSSERTFSGVWQPKFFASLGSCGTKVQLFSNDASHRGTLWSLRVRPSRFNRPGPCWGSGDVSFKIR